MAWKIGELTRLPLGYVGENGTRTISIDVSAWTNEYPSALIAIHVVRPHDRYKYFAGYTKSGGVINWTVYGAEVMYAGKGIAQITLYDPATKQEYKSRVVETVVAGSIDEFNQLTLDEYDPANKWANKVLEAAERAEASRVDAEELVQAAANRQSCFQRKIPIYANVYGPLYGNTCSAIGKGDRIVVHSTIQDAVVTIRTGAYTGEAVAEYVGEWVADKDYDKVYLIATFADKTDLVASNYMYITLEYYKNYLPEDKVLIDFSQDFSFTAGQALSNGNVVNNEGTYVSGLVRIDQYESIKVSAARTAGTLSIGYYDAAGKLVTYSIVRSTADYSGEDDYFVTLVPDGIKYLRTTVRSTDGIIAEGVIANHVQRFADEAYHGVTRTVTVAPSNASAYDKRHADFVCDGVNDEAEINAALNLYADDVTVKLLAGDFYIDAFTTGAYGNYAIRQANTQRTLNKTIEGAGFGGAATTTIHVTAAALDALGDKVGSVFGVDQRVYGCGMSYRDFVVYLADNTHKVCVIDCQNTSKGFVERLRLNAVPAGIANTESTPMPAEGCVGVRGFCGDCSGVENIFSNIFATGFYEGFQLGGEHLVCTQLNARYNYYGYTFNNYDYWIGGMTHPMTLINCCDEHSACLPYFAGNGQHNEEGAIGLQSVDMFSFTLELYSPSTMGGGFVKPAEEQTPGSYCGHIEFNGYGVSNADGSVEEGHHNTRKVVFWSDGHGENFQTVNSTHKLVGTSEERFSYSPMHGQQYFDTTIGKLLTYFNGAWHGASGELADE